jgi:hypothetical protein
MGTKICTQMLHIFIKYSLREFVLIFDINIDLLQEKFVHFRNLFWQNIKRKFPKAEQHTSFNPPTKFDVSHNVKCLTKLIRHIVREYDVFLSII